MFAMVELMSSRSLSHAEDFPAVVLTEELGAEGQVDHEQLAGLGHDDRGVVADHLVTTR